MTNTDVSKENGASVFCFEILWARSQPKHYSPEQVGFRLTVSVGHDPCPQVLSAHFSSTGIYSTQNNWVFGLCPSSGILKTRKHSVSETGSVSVLR
jgi:hypothetical protein